MQDYKIHHQEIKSTLRKGSLPDFFFCSKFSFSPYMACQHGCVYCDGRAEKYYVKGNFEKDIVARTNVPATLEKELAGLRDRGIIAIGSGVSDAYQAAEENENLTGRCAEILSRCKRPVLMATKSALCLRDLPLWAKVNQNSRFILAISLTTLDERVREVFEPQASPVFRRLEVIRAFKARGCAVGVLAMPFLPGISDEAGSIEALFGKLAELDVDFVMPGSLTLRPGKQKDFYLRKIEDPALEKYYQEIYREEKVSGMPHAAYDRELRRKIGPLLKKYNFNPLIPPALYNSHYYTYDQVYLLLCHLELLYHTREVDTAPLKKALGYYTQWLKEARSKYTRKRGGFSELDYFFKELCAGNSFLDVIKNEKLFMFIKKVVLEKAVYDYKKLEFINTPVGQA